MTQEDREEIGAIVRQAISSNNEVIFAAIRATEEHLGQRIDGVEHSLSQRIESVEHRLDHLTKRVDQTNQIMLTMDARLGALTRAVEHLQSDHGVVLDTQAAQQKALDALAARVAKLEAQHPH